MKDPFNKSASSQPADGIGRWMVYLAWLLLILLLTFLFTRWLDLRQNPNRNLQVTFNQGGQSSVVLQRNPAGHYLAPGTINGRPVVFLLDTGATYVALSENLANKAGLSRGITITSQTANGMVRGWLTRIDEVQLGPISLRDISASILPSMPDNEVLLGMSFLKHLELVQSGNQLLLRVPAT